MPATLAHLSSKTNAGGSALNLPLDHGFAKSSGSISTVGRATASASPAVRSQSVPRQSLLFGSLSPYAPGWAIRQPLPVSFITDEDGTFIVSDEVVPTYGTGETISEAMADYVTSLVELYEIVERDVAKGVPHTEEELARLAFFLIRLR